MGFVWSAAFKVLYSVRRLMYLSVTYNNGMGDNKSVRTFYV